MRNASPEPSEAARDRAAFLAIVRFYLVRRLLGFIRIEQTRLPLAALKMALAQRGRPGQVIHHSDRGVQYASAAYREALQKSGLIASMSRKANCYDNAAMESFWSTLKIELHDQRMETLPRNTVRQLVFEYIEAYYNRRRLHSSLGYKTPVEFETNLN